MHTGNVKKCAIEEKNYNDSDARRENAANYIYEEEER